LGGANGFIGAVDAAYPATGAPFALGEFFDGPLDVILARGSGFDAYGPADPFIAGERRNIFPCRQSFCARVEGFLQICGQFVRGSAGYIFSHTSILPSRCRLT